MSVAVNRKPLSTFIAGNKDCLVHNRVAAAVCAYVGSAHSLTAFYTGGDDLTNFTT